LCAWAGRHAGSGAVEAVAGFGEEVFDRAFWMEGEDLLERSATDQEVGSKKGEGGGREHVKSFAARLYIFVDLLASRGSSNMDSTFVKVQPRQIYGSDLSPYDWQRGPHLNMKHFFEQSYKSIFSCVQNSSIAIIYISYP
jgi:hypothetical protein